MSKVSGLAFVGLLLAGTSVIADPPFKPKPRGDEQVCRSEAQTGTRFRTRVCHTRAEWEAIEEAARRSAADMINKPIIETRRGG